jgi:hypothetical protein
MPRAKKQTVDYFPHYCDHKTTMFIIEQRYGNDGYAFWFKLLETLGKENGHWLDLRDPLKWEFLQAKTRTSEGFCNELLDLLSKLNAIDPELWQIKVVWSQNFVDGLTPVYGNRRVDIPERPAFLLVEKTPFHDESTGSLQEEIPKGSKGSKVKNNFLSDSQEIGLAKLLFEKIQERDPKAKQPDFQKWAAHIDKLMRLDKRDSGEIESVIEWCQQDTFWRRNILSAEKLRDKFGQLVQGMNNGNGNRKESFEV